jgi:hypothetical protein
MPGPVTSNAGPIPGRPWLAMIAGSRGTCGTFLQQPRAAADRQRRHESRPGHAATAARGTGRPEREPGDRSGKRETGTGAEPRPRGLGPDTGGRTGTGGGRPEPERNPTEGTGTGYGRPEPEPEAGAGTEAGDRNGGRAQPEGPAGSREETGSGGQGPHRGAGGLKRILGKLKGQIAPIVTTALLRLVCREPRIGYA